MDRQTDRQAKYIWNIPAVVFLTRKVFVSLSFFIAPYKQEMTFAEKPQRKNGDP